MISKILSIFLSLGASSLMVARGALWNASVFSPEGKVPLEDVKREYVREVWPNFNYITSFLYFMLKFEVLRKI